MARTERYSDEKEGFIKEIKRKTKGMTAGQKFDHLWEYYKIHAAVFIIIIIVVGYLLNIFVINPPRTEVFTLITYGDFSDEIAFKRVSEELTEMFVADPEKEVIQTVAYYFQNYAPNNSLSQRFMAELMINGIDLIFTDDQGFTKLAAQGVLKDLTTILPEELLLQYEDRLLTAVGRDAIGEASYGLRINPDGYFSFFGDEMLSDKVLCIGTNKDTSVYMDAFLFMAE